MNFIEKLKELFNEMMMAKEPEIHPTPDQPVYPAVAPVIEPHKVDEMRVSRIPRKGDSGIDIKMLQIRLCQLGYMVPIDGKFGKMTANAISKLQKAIGSGGSGIIGTKTLAHLNMAVMSPPGAPEHHTVAYFKVKSNRKVPDELRDAITAEIKRFAPVEFHRACVELDANLISGLVADAMVALEIRERTNRNDGKHVELIQKVCGGSKGQAWCMYFDQVCIGMAEMLTGQRSYVYPSGSCASVRTNTPKYHQVDLKSAQYGDLIIWMYLEGSRKGLGHTGIFKRWIKPGESFECNEGNTTEGVEGSEIVRDGGGAYQTRRLVKNTKMKIAMVLRPFVEVK